MKRWIALGAVCMVTLLTAVPAQAQLNGSHSLGDFGVQSGSQPAPGFYAALFYYRYDTDTIKDADGNTVRLAPDTPGSLGLTAVAPILWYVSKAKVLGANYGAMVVLPFANASLEAPAFQLGQTRSTPASPTCWCARSTWAGTPSARTSPPGFRSTSRRADTSAAAATTSGRACGRTSRSWARPSTSTRSEPLSLATTAYWEFHGKKEDTDVKVGQILTLQGGLGKSFLGGGLIVGAAYYAQWKLTEDQLSEFVLPGGGDDRHGRPQQAQGVRLRAGRDAAGRDASRSSSPWSTSAISGKRARG